MSAQVDQTQSEASQQPVMAGSVVSKQEIEDRGAGTAVWVACLSRVTTRRNRRQRPRFGLQLALLTCPINYLYIIRFEGNRATGALGPPHRSMLKQFNTSIKP